MNRPNNSSYNASTFERWRPALLSLVVLAIVIAVGVQQNQANKQDNNTNDPGVVADSGLTTAITVPLSRNLESGMQGDDVLRLQQRLKDLHFDPGPVDGMFGQNTVQAMWAFEKLVLGVPREEATGILTPATWSIMQTSLKFVPQRKADSATHVEVYLPQQLMIVFTNQEPVLITHISSGTGEQWCEEVKIDPGEEGNDTATQVTRGICGQAITPGGIFYFYNRRTGMRETKLGSLYNPVYFNYNIAVHGAVLVPLKPASHGCIRIPMSVARYFPALVKYGDRVYVFDGNKEPELYGSPVPPYDKPDPNYTTIPTVTSLPAVTSLPVGQSASSLLPTATTLVSSVTTTTIAKSTATNLVSTTTTP